MLLNSEDRKVIVCAANGQVTHQRPRDSFKQTIVRPASGMRDGRHTVLPKIPDIAVFFMTLAYIVSQRLQSAFSDVRASHTIKV